MIKGAGELASGVAHCLSRCHFNLCMTEIAQPLAVRREVSFSEAVYDGEQEIEGVTGSLISHFYIIKTMWQEEKIPILVDPEVIIKDFLKPDVLVDAIIAKKNLGTTITDASLVIGLGPGFRAGKDVHVVIETNRGHNLGKVILEGEAEPNTGIPGMISNVTKERVLYAPEIGRFTTSKKIGDFVQEGEIVGMVGSKPIRTLANGVVRGLLRNGLEVDKGTKMGDVDPRGIREYCYTISDKARTIAGGVLEAILSHFNI
ncbi:selenium-dependent molybdenum cofactor biosynthesis protein YqeB [Chloroflexota bacterium]